MTAEARKLVLTPSTYGPDSWASPNVLRTRSRYVRSTVRLGIGYQGPGGECRRVYQGPLLPGPYAYAYPHATVIDNFGGTGREMQENEAAGLEWEVEHGDLFEIGGYIFRLIDDRPMDYPALTLVGPVEESENNVATVNEKDAPKNDENGVPLNWIDLAQNAPTESARAYWAERVQLRKLVLGTAV